MDEKELTKLIEMAKNGLHTTHDLALILLELPAKRFHSYEDDPAVGRTDSFNFGSDTIHLMVEYTRDI
jgi:hypothetical protein